MVIQENFCLQAFELFRSEEHRACISHTALLTTFSETWSKLFSKSTCFYCLVRRPEYTLRCGHSFCPSCVMILAEDNGGPLGKHHLKECPLCQEPDGIVINIKSYTAGIRVLVIDGGGYADLEPLRTIENTLSLSSGLMNYFDFINRSGLGKTQSPVILHMLMIRK